MSHKIPNRTAICLRFPQEMKDQIQLHIRQLRLATGDDKTVNDWIQEAIDEKLEKVINY